MSLHNSIFIYLTWCISTECIALVYVIQYVSYAILFSCIVKYIAFLFIINHVVIQLGSNLDGNDCMLPIRVYDNVSTYFTTYNELEFTFV